MFTVPEIPAIAIEIEIIDKTKTTTVYNLLIKTVIPIPLSF